jgi:hypothetical protein
VARKPARRCLNLGQELSAFLRASSVTSSKIADDDVEEIDVTGDLIRLIEDANSER